jgi:RNA polymerase sigma factor (sigma-70 family)
MQTLHLYKYIKTILQIKYSRLAAKKEIAEDIIQDVIVKLIQNNKLDTDNTSYISLTVRSVVIDYIRSEETTEEYFEESLAVDSDITSRIDLKRALDTMSPKSKSIFVLYAQGYSNIEIAKKLNISSKTIQRTLGGK